jgi:hypothetical protein
MKAHSATQEPQRGAVEPPVGKILRLTCWLVLAVFVALTVYGFEQAKLFRQEIWTATGLRRFLLFAACYWLFFGLFAVLRPRIFPALVLTAVLIYTLAATGVLAVASVLLVVLSSLVLGQGVLKSCGLRDDGSATMDILAALLGLSLYMFVLSFAALERVNYPVAYLAALAAPLIWQWRRAIDWLARVPRLWKPLAITRSEQFAGGALIFVLMLHWLVVLEPEIGPDALSIHLVIPESMRVAHRWHFDVTRHLQAVMPKGANWLYTLCYFLGGEFAARLFNLASLLGIVGLLLATIRRWLTPTAALLLSALFAATPLVQLVTGSLFVENEWALLGFGALISLGLAREGGRPQFLYLAMILLGAAIASKSIALAFVPPFGLIMLWTLWRRRGFLEAAVAALCLLVFAIPPYWIAYAKTGNPVFPYFPAVFASKYQRLAEGFAGPPPTGPRTLAAGFLLTFRSGLYREVQNGAVGFQYFLLVPLAIAALRRKWPDIAKLSGLTFALFTVATLRTDPTPRYFYAALAPATVFIAAAFAWLRSADSRLYRVSMVLAAAVFCLDVYFIPSSNWMFKDFVKNPASRQARLDFVTAHVPERNLVAYLNRAHSGAPVAFFESNAIAGLRATAFTTTWHNVDFYHGMLDAATPAECWRILHDNGVRFVIAPLPESGIPISTAPQETFLRQCTEAETISGKYYAGVVKESCAAESEQPPPVLPPGEYDDWDSRLRYTGLWSRLRFDQASHGTITASQSAGADLELRFEGSEVTYVYTKAFNRGKAEVLLDGASQGLLDLYSPRIEWKTATSFRAAGPGPHTFQVRVSGRKQDTASGSYVDVDEIVVR